MPYKIHFRETGKRQFYVLPTIKRPWLLAAIFLLGLSTQTFSQARTFITKFRPLADSLSDEYGIPSSVILGVSLLESGSGQSRNCKLLNNYFGMEGKNDLKKTRGIKTRYKQYPNAQASFVDFCRLMTRKKFYKKLKGNMNHSPWLDAISKAGYSEVPELWKERVGIAIRKHKLYASN